MARDWTRFLANARTDAGRAIVEQGRRIDEARGALPADAYTNTLAKAGITVRDARLLATIGQRLGPLLEQYPSTRLPVRLRTLLALSDLSTEALLQAAAEGQVRATMTEADVRTLLPARSSHSLSVIKPTDSWNFSTLRWPRIDGYDGHGYVPGDLYANCLWYYAHHGDTVVDPMAGSGVLLRVWEDRSDWADLSAGLESPTFEAGDDRCEWNLEIVLSDLCPRGPYREQILTCDLLEGFPTERADYIIIDPPYCGLVSGQYSALTSDLANMDIAAWTNALGRIALRFRAAQSPGGRCTVIVPNNRDITTGERELLPETVRRLFQEAGYRLYDVTYASRRTQRTQGRRMGILNNRAKRERTPLADVAEVLTFHLPFQT